jgi:hypothetical protein
MRAPAFDLGFSREDQRALAEARRSAVAVDPAAALKLMTDVSALVDAAVRRRPLHTGKPFTLPTRDSAVHAADPGAASLAQAASGRDPSARDPLR